MIWHIFRKDWKLLWRIGLATAALQCLAAVTELRMGLFHSPQDAFGRAAATAAVLGMLSAFVLIAEAVHQDPLTGVTDDWLVRPIRRSHLLLAKLLFVLVVVHGSMLVVLLFLGLACGFPLWQSLGAAALESVNGMWWTLPALALASLTRSLTQMVVVVAATAAALLLASMNLIGGTSSLLSGPTSGSVLGWVADTSGWALFVLGALAVLYLQYSRRNTSQARVLALAAACLWIASDFMPWQTAFAIQQHLAAKPDAAAAVQISFNGEAGRAARFPAAGEATRIYLPLRIGGVPANTWLKVDRMDITMTEPDGSIAVTNHVLGSAFLTPGDTMNLDVNTTDPGIEFKYRTPAAHDSDLLTGIRDSAFPIKEPGHYQAIDTDSAEWDRLKDRPLQLRLDYTLTLMGPADSYAVPALNGDRRMPGVGRCETRVAPNGNDIQLRCVSTSMVPTCATAFLEEPLSGLRNPPVRTCKADYSPLPGDTLEHWGDSLNLPIRDRNADTPLPVDGSKLARSIVALKTFEPLDHFARQVTVSNIRLREWLPK